MTRVAINGIRGTYAEEAAVKYFGPGVEILELGSFGEALNAVRSGKTEFAVIPVANSIIGQISSTAELVTAAGLTTDGEVSVQVAHVLAVKQGSSLDHVTSVRSHVEALRQCSRFLAGNPQILQVAGPDTATCVRAVVDGASITEAAICSIRAAEIYGARVLEHNIADSSDNATTFAVLKI